MKWEISMEETPFGASTMLCMYAVWLQNMEHIVLIGTQREERWCKEACGEQSWWTSSFHCQECIQWKSGTSSALGMLI